jgi:hypothetical protein
VREGPLPPEVVAHVLELTNRPDVLVMPGRSRIPAGSVVQGDVVVLGGSLTLGGTVTGELAVVNGSLTLAPGSRVTGPVTVVGGRVSGEEEARLEGPVVAFGARLHYRIRGNRVEAIPPDERTRAGGLATDLGFGQSRLTVRAAGPYNRVEGLPLEFGPIFETEGRNPLVVEAFGVWRSEGGLAFDTDRMGYDFSLVQGVGGRGTMSVGAEIYSRVRSIEDRGMSNLETALSTFLRRIDYRDHLEAEGWSVHFEAHPLRYPVRFRVAFREEEHAPAFPTSPWTLGDGDRAWRLQPAVAEGTARFLETEVAWDTRDDPERPSDGWWWRFKGVRQVGGTLRGPYGPEVTGDGPVFPRFTRGELDLRRYARLSRSARLKIRIAATGATGSAPLPPQFQSALGGEGSLPGHPRFALDCGVRELEPVVGLGPRGDRLALPAYGCDRVGLAQLEFQRDLPVVWNPVPEMWRGSEWAGLVQIQPTLSVFLNGGQGWARSRDGFVERTDSPTRADAGIGISTGSLGLYWAHPLNRTDRGINFFVRLDHRF